MGRGLPQIPESLLAKLWQQRAARQKAFTARDGRRVQVLYPGRLSAAAGPDFRDAIVRVQGRGVVRGDVEVHREQRDWHAHGHDTDPNYDCVVLHAILKPGGHPESPPPGGAAPLVVSLRTLLDGTDKKERDADPWRLLACHGFRRPDSPAAMERLLDMAGDQRFVLKARAFERRLEAEQPPQVLYEALMEALGYNQNRLQFLELARRLPYQRLLSLAQECPPAERPTVLHEALVRAGDGLAWHTFRVRPSNHPRRRVKGAALLLARHIEPSLEGSMTMLVRRGVLRSLVLGLAIQDGNDEALIGPGRAADMAVNVVLPYCHARGRLRGDHTLSCRALHTFREAPRLQENELTHEMHRLLLPPDGADMVAGARRQQGLIHLYRLLTCVGTPSGQT
jgi:hypothetical protein